MTAQGQGIIDFIAGRQSARVAELQAPAPDDTELQRLLAAAMSAPDHGAIRPWRFLAIRDEGRSELGDVFARALKARQPDCRREDMAAIRAKPLRAPLIVAAAAQIHVNHPKTPPVEQVIACACATQNFLLAAASAGWGAVILSGWPAHDDYVKQALGLAAKDWIIGFVYMGTVAGAADTSAPVRSKRRPDPANCFSRWPNSPG